MFRKNGKADGFVELYFIAKKAYTSVGLLIFCSNVPLELEAAFTPD